MYNKLRFFELKNTKFKTNHNFFIELSKVLEMGNFRFLANFRFLTLYLKVYLTLQIVKALEEVGHYEVTVANFSP